MDLDSIIQHYIYNGDFSNLKRANVASNQKLISVCKKYLTDQPQPIVKSTLKLNNDESSNEAKDFLEPDGTNSKSESESLVLTSDILIQPSSDEVILKEPKIEIPNYRVHELAQMEGLSVRTINVCKRYELIDLTKILHYYYVENGNFKHLRNCGRKSIEELVSLCEKYMERVIYPTNIHTTKNELKISPNEEYRGYTSNIIKTTWNELIKNENLSARSQNVCIDNGMTDLSSIISYYWANEDFLQLKNCGQKSNLELIGLCKKFEHLTEKPRSEVIDAKTLNPIISKIELLTIKQKQVINNLLVAKFNELPVRPQNALNALLNNEITLKNICDTIFLDRTLNINKIRNVGEKSEVEIQAFIELIKEQIELVVSCQDEREIEIKLCETYLMRNFSNINSAVLSTIRDFNFSNGIPLFKIIKILIDNNILFEFREKQIFNNEFCRIDEKEFKSLRDLSKEIGVTMERARQIRQHFLGNFESYFRFITQPEIKSLVNYNIDLSTYFIDITDEVIDRINIKEEVKFNQIFINRIFGCLYYTNFEFVGKYSQNYHGKNIALDKWKRSYLIDKKITELFDFEKFYDDIKSRISDRIEEDYSFYFQTYLMNFLKSNKYEMLENIVDITEYMLLNEFELILDTNENIVFKRNTKKQVIEYVHEVLAEKNEPMTVYEIYDLIQRNHPGVTKNAEAVRGSCQRDSKLIFFGRSSTYGLKIWEDELDIKGGTIREIAEEFLHNQTEPKHVDEITEYVNKYRNTNSKSVYANLKVDEQKRFAFFCGQLIGLSSKVYSTEKYIETNDVNIDRKTWEERFSDLQKFAEENDRLPNSVSNDKEIVLYRFMNIQLNKAMKSQIDDDKASRINELVEKYKYKKRKRKVPQEWNTNYTELVKLVVDKKRPPNARIEEEKKLYDFFYRQRKLYQDEKLPLEFVEKLLEIAKLLN